MSRLHDKPTEMARIGAIYDDADTRYNRYVVFMTIAAAMIAASAYYIGVCLGSEPMFGLAERIVITGLLSACIAYSIGLIITCLRDLLWLGAVKRTAIRTLLQLNCR